jgi:type II secretory pathway component GspD/PulD (secretin)
MSTRSQDFRMPGRYVSRILAVIGVALVAGWTFAAAAADPTFVGVLSLAVEKDVADKIDLSDDVRTKLQDMVAEREEAALELVLEIKDLSEEEKAKKLAPFVAESEKMGLALLTDEQRAGLEQARIARAGMLSLTEAPVSKKLKFTPEQQEKITSLLKEREEQLATTSDDKRSIQLRYYEQKLAKVLTPEQKATWDELAGLQTAEKVPDDESTAKSDDSKTDDEKSDVAKTDDTKTDTTKPAATKPDTSKPATKVTGKEKPADDDMPVVRHKVSPDGKLRFNFRSAAWKDVLDWFSAQADMSLEAETYPPGTFNYTDKHAYTTGEALDVLNGVLLTKGYTLVRRGRLLMVVNLEDAPPFDRLVSRIEPKDLDERGEFELVGCLFQLDKLSPEDAESEIKKLIGPQGSIVILPKSRQIYVTESAGKLRTIRSIIERVENPDAGRELKLTEIMLEHISPETALQSIRPLMGIPEDRAATPDGALKMVPDEKAGRLIVSGKPDAIAKIQEIIKLVDIPTGEDEGPSLLDETPQIAIYKLAGLDANVVLPVMQTILADMPNVRLTIDTKANSLIAQAPLKQHNTIRETLREMQKDKSQFDVITLRRVDPQLAVLTINKMFGAGEGGDPNAPKVDADPTTRQLIVRGTTEQVASIRSLLEKMGEAGGEDVASEDRGPVRVLGYAGSNPQALFDQAKEVWPTVTTNSNRLRFVTPAKDAATNRPREMRVPREQTPEETPVETDPTSDVEKQFNDFLERRGLPPLPTKPKAKAAPADAKSTRYKHARVPAKFAAYQPPADDSETEEFIPPPITKKPAAVKDDSAAAGEKKEKEKEKKPSKPGAEIVVSIGPSGIVIASEDLEALDEFEALLRSLMDRSPAGGAQDFTIVYLKYAKADIAAALLQEILGAGGSDAGGGGGGGGLLGNIASMALGGGGGGGGGDLIGGLLGLGGGGDEGGGTAAIQTTGKVTIIPDPRLNALVVQAGAADLELVEQLLKVIDQEFSPEDVQTQPIPRMIAVKFVTADEVAAVVREVYASRIAAAAGGGGQRQQPSPEEFIRALRGGGGRGGRGGAGDKQRGEEQKMTIGVDKRSNSLIVSAPDPLFREVEKLVAQIDKAGTETDDVTTVVQIKNASPELVKNAISAHFGDKAQMNTTPQTAGPQATQGGAVAGGPQGRGGQGQGQGRRGGQGGQGGGAQDPAAFFNGLQQAIQGGGGGGGRGGQRGGGGGGGGGQRGGGGAGGGRGGR